MPLVLDGHRSPVECICTDGDVVFSVCLAGQLYLWDIQTGCAIAHVDRNAYFNSARQVHFFFLFFSLISLDCFSIVHEWSPTHPWMLINCNEMDQ